MASYVEDHPQTPEIIVDSGNGQTFSYENPGLTENQVERNDKGKINGFRALVRKSKDAVNTSPGLLSLPKSRLPSAKRERKKVNKGQGLAGFLFGSQHISKVQDLEEDDSDVELDSESICTLWQAVRENKIKTVSDILTRSPEVINELDNLGYGALHLAAKQNCVAAMSVLIQHNADVNLEGPYSMRPLHCAAKYNSCDAAELLIRSKASVMCQDAKMKTPLHLAARRGHLQMAKMLLSGDNAIVVINAIDEDELTPLFDAVMHRHTKLAHLLVEAGANIYAEDINETLAFHHAASEELLELMELFMRMGEQLYGTEGRVRLLTHPDNEGFTALHMAVLNNKVKASEYLLRNGSAANKRNSSHSAPLHIAAVNGNVAIASLLLSYNATLERRDKEQMTPMHRAALYNRQPVVELLMSKGGDLDAKSDDQMTPLMLASWKGHIQTTNFLLSNGAQVNEVDNICRTVLHIAVQYGRYEILLHLLQHGCSTILEALDQTDQTALHYAAKLGDKLIISALLQHNCRLDARDQDGLTPLHIAAEYSNSEAIDILMQASQTELNDADSDGKTPLMVAVDKGNYNTTQSLLHHGADLSMRDDEYRTALMIASAAGHTKLVKLLLDNYSEINHSDKVKNTPLHMAAYIGHVDCTKLLLCRHAKVTLRNSYGKTPLDVAIDSRHTDVVIQILSHRSWRDSMDMRDAEGFTPMKRLIEKVPEAAKVVMDNCVEYSDHGKDDIQYTHKFDYKYVDPGPCDPCCQQMRYFAVHTMVEYKREELLGHPIVQSMLLMKWRKFGRFPFFFNLISYMLYLLFLTMYMDRLPKITTSLLDDVRACPVTVNDSVIADPVIVEQLKTSGTYSYIYITDPTTIIYNYLLIAIIMFYILRQILGLLVMRTHYFRDPYTYVTWTMLISTMLFLNPSGYIPCTSEWRAGWVATISAWTLFMLNLRGLNSIGLYFVMFTEVLWSLFKILSVLVVFLMAFSSAFSITMAQTDGLAPYSMYPLTVLSMTLGELGFVNNYMNDTNAPFVIDNYILMTFFMIFMPIALMNLLIGVAVGDIDKIQKEAYINRLSLQIEHICAAESNFPKFLQKKSHQRRYEMKPNLEKVSCWNQLKKRVFKSNDTSAASFINEEKGDVVSETLNVIRTDMRKQKAMLLQMQMAQKQQQEMMKQLCTHMDIDYRLSRLSPVESIRSEMLSRIEYM